MIGAVLLCSVIAAQAAVGPAQPRDFASARTAAAALPQLRSLLVSHRGRLALEHYAPKHSATRLANIKSASKSVI
nr:hypothetical protein [Acidobacteriota bacterium]